MIQSPLGALGSSCMFLRKGIQSVVSVVEGGRGEGEVRRGKCERRAGGGWSNSIKASTSQGPLVLVPKSWGRRAKNRRKKERKKKGGQHKHEAHSTLSDDHSRRSEESANLGLLGRKSPVPHLQMGILLVVVLVFSSELCTICIVVHVLVAPISRFVR